MAAVELEPLPPREAIDAFIARGRRLAPTFDWREVYGEIHQAMFTVAKSAGHDILQDIYDALLQALERGETYETFARRLKAVLVDKGWWGERLETDPQTGETVRVRLGSPRRLATIFDANMRVSYASGHWAQFERTKTSRPYLRYVAVLDGRTRPEHRARHNVTLPVDHPWWDVWAPPCGWNCRCTLQALSEREYRAMAAELITEPPPDEYRAWTNRRTGETRSIPVGIDPGWDYNPGKAGHSATVRELERRGLPPIGEGA